MTSLTTTSFAILVRHHSIFELLPQTKDMMNFDSYYIFINTTFIDDEVTIFFWGKYLVIHTVMNCVKSNVQSKIY